MNPSPVNLISLNLSVNILSMFDVLTKMTS